MRRANGVHQNPPIVSLGTRLLIYTGPSAPTERGQHERCYVGPPIGQPQSCLEAGDVPKNDPEVPRDRRRKLYSLYRCV